MNDLVVKSVNLMGDEVMAAQDSDGNIWAGVSWFCNALGMQKWQKDKQIQKVQNDKALQKGCSKFGAGVFDPNNETVSLRIDFIPIWLAKITITDKMQKDHPDLADKLLNYQLKAKDILAQAFMPHEFPKTTKGQIQLLAQGYMEMEKKVDGVINDVKNVKSDLESLKMDLPILPIEADRITEAVKRKGVSVLGGKHSNAYQNRGLRQKLYNSLYANLKYNFGVKSYKSIKRSQCDKAIEIINAYQPPVFIAEQIEYENAQMGFKE